MGSVYDRTEKEYYHNKRHCCTCRDTGILLPNCGQGQLLPDAVFLSAQLYLYRPVRRLGAFCPPADRAKAGMQVYDGLFAAWGRASKEIGNEFGVSANLVCAWVSKARKYLKSLPEILALAEI